MKIAGLQNVMVSIGMMKAMAGDILGAGLPHVFRTKKQQEATNLLYTSIAEVNTPCLDVFRLQRTDQDGEIQADGGYVLFGKEGQEIVSVRDLTIDLEKNGFHLAVAETFEKEGDGKRMKLRLTWSRNSETRTSLTGPQKLLVHKYLNKVYWKLFGFYNQDSVSLEGDTNPIQGSIITLNFSGVLNGKQVADNLTLIRDVRMIDSQGHLRCLPRDPVVTATYNAAKVLENSTSPSPSSESQKPAM